MQTDSTLNPQAVSGTRTASRSEALVGAGLAMLLGLFLVWGVGFSHVEAAHNAAHDTRHSNVFPCH